MNNESELEDIEGQVEIDSDEEEHSDLTGESDLDIESSESHESESDDLSHDSESESEDIESFAVGEVKELEIPEAKPGLSVALEIDTEDGKVKLAEVPSEAVVPENVKKVDDL